MLSARSEGPLGRFAGVYCAAEDFSFGCRHRCAFAWSVETLPPCRCKRSALGVRAWLPAGSRSISFKRLTPARNPRTAGDPRIGRRHARQDGESPATPWHIPVLRGSDRAQSTRRPRADDGPLGHAVTGVRSQGEEVRSWHHQCPQCEIPALETLARGREPVCRAFH
jgi:hypothetical protein